MQPLFRPRSVSLAEAFDKVYPAIFRYFRYRGANADTANDLASTTFERALLHIATFDPQQAQIQTWLFAIAHNIAINHWKAENAHGFVDLDDDLPTPDDLPLEQTIILAQDKAQILPALQALDDRSREIVALKFGGLLTNRQIAELTDLTESNVGVILYRALLKLRTLLTAPTEARHE
ncbi:MAG: sigma-70 family RNA polymerase sigma factor [Chloroflexota bacterium]